MTSPRFVALVVNHDSGPFALACARSLRHEWWLLGGAEEDLEIAVWDNGSEREDGCWLQALEAEGARVFASRENFGLAGAIQRLYAQTTGGPDDYLAIVHPDVMLVPGALKVLIQHLDGHPEVGIVSPRQVLDEQGQFQVASPPTPGPLEELGREIGKLAPRVASMGPDRRWRTILAELAAEIPFEREHLTGGFYLMARQVADDLGHLMDTRFPFTYEEADLCRRVRARGLNLVVHPRALALHACGRSRAAAGEDSLKRRRYISRRSFLSLYASGAERRMLGWMRTWAERKTERQLASGPANAIVLGSLEESPTISLPPAGPWLMEVARTPDCEPWLTCMSRGGQWRFQASAWAWLEPGTYWVSARHATTGKRHRVWSLRKTSASRLEPIWDPRTLGLGAPSGVAASMVLAGAQAHDMREVA